MKATRKRVSMKDALGNARNALRDLLVEQPKAWLTNARARLDNLPKTNFDLGVMFTDQGKWVDALFRFRVTRFFQADYPFLSLQMGRCYFLMGDHARAKPMLLEALRQHAGDQSALFMLAYVDPAAVPKGQMPERMPRDMVIGFFTGMAYGYDIEEANSKYQAGKIVYDMLKPLVKSPTPALLDLACGSGIVARPWRAAASTITGVDCTPAMLDSAMKAAHANKPLYDALFEADVTQLPVSIAPASADLVLMVNAASYIGELGGVLRGAANAMKPDALLVVTFEPYGAASGFGLSQTNGRFTHSAAYVTQAAQTVGLSLVKEASVELYPTIPAVAMVFSKGTN
jgi:predicted TPR repeat methyltransferase